MGDSVRSVFLAKKSFFLLNGVLGEKNFEMRFGVVRFGWEKNFRRKLVWCANVVFLYYILILCVTLYYFVLPYLTFIKVEPKLNEKILKRGVNCVQLDAYITCEEGYIN